MASVNLVKPGLLRGAVITTSSPEIGPSGSSFVLKLLEAEYDFYSPAEDTTGDGDEHPKFENNLMLYGDIRMRGVAKANAGIGLYNLVSSSSGVADKNPLTKVHTFKLGPDYASAPQPDLIFRMFIERIAIRWDYDGPYLGLLLTGKMSDMTDAQMQAIQTLT